jgi:hypothetical protein
MTENKHSNLRKMNRAILNPITKLFAGRFFYSLVFHKGRRSNKDYSTPIVATKRNKFIYIPLPYGADTDWYLNVKSLGKCKVKIDNRLYSCMGPEIVDSTIALPSFALFYRASFKRANINQYLRLIVME